MSLTPRRVLLFGATGMIGQGVLRECLRADGVEAVTAVGRRAPDSHHEKLRGVTCADLAHLASVETTLAGHDACIFCIGVSSAGMSEAEYTRQTYDLTLGIAARLVALEPAMTFVYVSAAGADSSETGRVMWARVRGRLENALMALPFRAVFIVRPALVIPMHGIRSRTRAYRVAYAVLGPILPLLKRLAPRYVLTTESLGLGLLRLAGEREGRGVLESGEVPYR